MSEKLKWTTLVIFFIVLIAILLVSISLHGLTLRAGTPFPSGNTLGNDQGPSIETTPVTSGGLVQTVVLAVLGPILVVIFIYALVNFHRKAELVRFIRSLVPLLLLAAILVFFSAVSRGRPLSPEAGTVVPPTPLSPQSYAVGPIGQPSLVFLWMIFGVLIAAILGLLFWILLRRRDQALQPNEILQQAETAVQALRRGEDYRSVILACYLQMTRVLKEEQGIKRDANLTAREFKELLGKRGISPAPVSQLTSLFESARYSPLKPGEQEEQAGLDCLNEIIQDSRRMMGQ